jgi:hypothetical protein
MAAAHRSKNTGKHARRPSIDDVASGGVVEAPVPTLTPTAATPDHLIAGEAVPTAPAFPRCEITNVDDDCPVAGRAFAVSFHCFFPRFGRPLFDDFDPYLRGVKLTEALSAKGRIGCAESANFFKSVAMSIINHV